MLLSEHDLKLMGENGRNIAKQYFLWDSIVHKTIELYKWLLDGGEKPDFIYLGDSQMKDENIFKKS